MEHQSTPRPQEYTIEIDGQQIPVLRALDGQEYINVVNSEKYTGFSRYMLYDRIQKTEKELGRTIRNKFKGKGSYILRSQLDEMIKEVYTPQPLERTRTDD